MRERPFLWRTADGRIYELQNIEDDHLLNIERYLLGRGEIALSGIYKLNHAVWQRTYNIIRDEIDRRGLSLKEQDNAPRDDDAEKLKHQIWIRYGRRGDGRYDDAKR